MMRKSFVLRRGTLLAWVIVMSACNDSRESYSRIYEVVLARQAFVYFSD